MIYPNPTNGKFTISFSQPELVLGSQMLKQVQHDVSIYNVLGEKVYQSIANRHSSLVMPPTTSAPMTIDLSEAPKGIYFVNIYDGTTMCIRKIVVQ
jgi:hypothetical protein